MTSVGYTCPLLSLKIVAVNENAECHRCETTFVSYQCKFARLRIAARCLRRSLPLRSVGYSALSPFSPFQRIWLKACESSLSSSLKSKFLVCSAQKEEGCSGENLLELAWSCASEAGGSG